MAESSKSSRPSGDPVAARLAPAMVRELDRIARAMERAAPGLRVSRGDVVRVLLREALDARKRRG